MSTARAKRSNNKERELGRYVLDLDSLERIYDRDLGRNVLFYDSDEQIYKDFRRLHIGKLPEKRYTKVFDFTKRGLEDWEEFKKIFVNYEDFDFAFDETFVLKAGLDAERGFLDVAAVSTADHGEPIGTFWFEEVWRIPVRKV